jgi:superfamily II DNA or RNA helicase
MEESTDTDSHKPVTFARPSIPAKKPMSQEDEEDLKAAFEEKTSTSAHDDDEEASNPDADADAVADDDAYTEADANADVDADADAGEEGMQIEAPPLWLEEKIIEKILATKKNLNPETQQTYSMFYIKWKLMSYLHCTWEKQSNLELMDVNAKTKLRRFWQHPHENNNVAVPADEEEEPAYFNSDFIEVHRILSCDPPTTEHAFAPTEEDLQTMLDDMPPKAGDAEFEVWYYVKWRSLPYNECSWERAYDLRTKCADVMAFWNRQKMPKNYNYAPLNPSVHDYNKLETSPMYGGPDAGLTLRSYQLEGVNWLLWNWFHKRSCILADEMGLGKTIQTACFLHTLRANDKLKIRGPHLIIAPLSLIKQWESELAMWCPNMNCVVLHGNVEARDILTQNEFFYQEPFSTKEDIKDAKKKHAYKFDVLLTTYEVVVRDLSVISPINWKVLVLDEGHRLKNPASRAFEKLISIKREFCLLLTGTPLQNKTEELWSLLHFCNRQKFPRLEEFSKRFGDLKGSADVADLHSVLKPYLLRRIKEDVEKSLPPKQETIIEVTLTSIQKKYYRAVYEGNAEFLYRGAKASNGPCLMNVMMELRKCCNHPYLMNGVEERVLEDLANSSTTVGAPTESRNDIVNRAMIDSSGKLVLLDKLLPRLQQEGHKVLIFSQMVRALNIIEDFLRYRGYSYERLDGSTKVQDRLTAIERFGKPSLNTFIMLLSTKAGGLGLNLTAADTVIIYDSDWNPQNDLQAQARAHRIGQTRPVVVYRLLTRKTYEMQMFHKASLKLGLDRAVLAHTRREQLQEGNEKESGGSSTRAIDDALSVSEIDELLKKGAYDVFREDDSDIQEFMSADVDAILARSSKTVQHANNSGSGALGKFSKASFVSADDTEDVDINDPEFWWKTMRIENKSATAIDLADEAAAYNQIIIGPDGEPQIVRSSLRKRKRTENWSSSATSQDHLSKSSKKQFYQADEFEGADPFEFEGADSGIESSADEEEKPKKEQKKKQHKERKFEISDSSGDKSKKSSALLATLSYKVPGVATMVLPYPAHMTHVTRLEREAREREREAQQRMRTSGSSMFQHYEQSHKQERSSYPGGKPGRKQALPRASASNAPPAEKPAPACARKPPVDAPAQRPSEWTSTARDRCVDLLLRFGFGRWEAIRSIMSTAGKPDVGNRTKDEIESFCRNIVMQCGLAAVKTDSFAQDNPNHTEFIRHAIQAAVRVQGSIMAKEQEIEIPEVLLQQSFQNKLSAGRAIKALHRMDILNRVIAIVNHAVSRVLKAFPGRYTSSPPPTSLDLAVALIPYNVIVKYIVTNSARPPWLYVCDWWDISSDAYLILGTFLHGFSAYDDMGADPDLCFQSKIRKAYLLNQSIRDGDEEQYREGPYASLPASAGEGAVQPAGRAEPAVSIIRLDEVKRCRLVMPARRHTDYIGVASHPGSASWTSYVPKEAESDSPTPAEILGYFDDEAEAAKAYDKALRKRKGTTDICPNFDLDGNRTEFRASPNAVPPVLTWFHSSVYYGVRSAGSKWQAKIGYEGVLRHVGTFATDIEAAVVHDRFALAHAQHTSVKINFRSVRDIMSALQKFSERGDIKMTFFDVPAPAADAQDSPLDPGSFVEFSGEDVLGGAAIVPAYSEDAFAAPSAAAQLAAHTQGKFVAWSVDQSGVGSAAAAVIAENTASSSMSEEKMDIAEHSAVSASSSPSAMAVAMDVARVAEGSEAGWRAEPMAESVAESVAEPVASAALQEGEASSSSMPMPMTADAAAAAVVNGDSRDAVSVSSSSDHGRSPPAAEERELAQRPPASLMAEQEQEQEYDQNPMSQQGIEDIDMSTTETHFDAPTQPLLPLSRERERGTAGSAIGMQHEQHDMRAAVANASLAGLPLLPLLAQATSPTEAATEAAGSEEIARVEGAMAGAAMAVPGRGGRPGGGGMPDSRTLNRLLTYLLSISDATKIEEKEKKETKVATNLTMSVSARKAQAHEKNQRKLLLAQAQSQQHSALRLKQQEALARKQRHDPVFDNVKNKTDILRELIRSGKVQGPTVSVPYVPKEHAGSKNHNHSLPTLAGMLCYDVL